jgi:protein required for attachment to host cells
MGLTLKDRWVVVCDASRARIFRADAKRAGRYEQVREVVHPDSRAHVRDLVTDVSLGHGLIGAAPRSDPKWVEATKFARELSRILAQGLVDGAYKLLILVAPPAFLGVLQASFPDGVARRVEARVAKHLTKNAEHDLPDRISAALASATARGAIA